MLRSLPALVLAAAAGAAVTYFLVAPPAPTALLPRTDDSQPDVVSAPARVAAAAGVVERAAVYTNAARADAAALSRQARDAAAKPPSALRTFTLGVVLARYTEVDPARATALGRELRVSADVLGTLYAAWATADPARARAALAEIDDPVEATTIGLAMFAALGSDETAMRQIAADLPAGAERGFIVGAIAAVAETHPAVALDQALALTESGLGGLALQRIATEWARSDIAAALKAGDGIADPDLRATFQNTVLREWAQFDLDAVFAYYLALDVESQEQLASLGALRDVARLDPYRALELSARLPPGVRIGVEQTALQSLAQRDPEAALQYVSRLPPGQQQQIVRQSLSRAYGKKDPEAALAWARATGVRDNLFGVLAGVAITNPQLAFDVLATLPVADRAPAVQSLVNGAMGDRGTNFAVLTEGVLALEGSLDASFSGRSPVGMLLSSWAQRSPSAALEWAIANGERVPPAAFSTVSAAVARNDLASAEQYLTRVPAQARFAWIQGMAQAYAQTDPGAAATWVEQFRAEPAYATATAVIAQSLARLDPLAAAAMLDRIDSSGMDPQALAPATRSIGMAWARKDAPAAAEWARRIATDAERSMALRSVTEIWAGNDRAAARSWALRLPAGSARDAALGTLLATARTSAELDTALLPAFSSDDSRQSAITGAIFRIAQGDPADARLLAERHLTPERRQQVERTIGQIERQRTGAPPIFFSD